MQISKHLKTPLLLPPLSSLLLILSFPPFNLGFLAWVALLPLLLFIWLYAQSWKQAVFAGFLQGLLFFIYMHSYMALSVDFFFHPAMGYLAVFLGALYSAVFTAVFAFLSYTLCRKPISWLAPIAAASAWVLMEYTRSLGLLGHTGGFLGYSQVPYPFLLQIVSVYGYWGLSFLMVLFQGLLCFFLPLLLSLPAKNKAPLASPLKCSIGPVFFILLCSLGLGVPSLFSVEKESEPIRFILVQGNIPQEHILDADMAPANFQHYLNLTKEAYSKHGAADLVIWPETVYSTSVARRYPEPQQALARLAGSVETPVFFGGMYYDTNTFESYNSIYLQKPGREQWEPQRYDKIRLVPIAEYFPSPDLLNRLWDVRINLGLYSPGEEIQVFEVNSFSFGGIICFESYFPQPALDKVRSGAKQIFVLTNDAWFLDSIGLNQHAAVAAVRAVESGVGVTQVANTGFTISFDYTGRMVFQLPAWEEGFGLQETVLPRRTTLYRLWGNYFPWICLGLLSLALSYRYYYRNG